MFNGQDKQPYEFMFRNMLYIMMDKVTDEMMFTQDFFLFSDVAELSEHIFGKSLLVINEHLEAFLKDTYDAVQMLLLIVVANKTKQLMMKKLVNALDKFLDGVYSKLCATFFRIFELNLQSIKTASAKDISNLDFRPHYITRRFAEFTVSLLYLTQPEYMTDVHFVKKLSVVLGKLREEFEKLLIRLADARYKDWKSKTVYLINNYDLILTTYAERQVTSTDTQQFSKLMDIKTIDYAQEELRNSFGRLLQFVKENAQYVKDDITPTSSTTTAPTTTSPTPQPSTPEKKIAAKEEEVDNLLKEFNTNWKIELERINGTIMKQFSNYKCGMKLFQHIMEQLLENYTIFVKIIRKYYSNLRTRKHFTPETEITYEMKKLFVNFE